MKKLLIYFCTIICTIIPISGASYNAEVSKIENNFYGFEFSNDTLQKRVSRLEKTVYGKTLNGDINKRIKKLSEDISADVIGLEIPPVRDTFLEEEKIAEEDNSVNYPLVDEIEKKLFNKTYKNRDFHTRIVTIEKKLFGKIYDVEDYSSRMDRIKTKLYPDMVASEKIPDKKMNSYYDYNSLNSTDLSGTNYSRYNMPFGQQRYTRRYANYGDLAPYNDEVSDLNDELTQLEYDAFGTEFSNESTKNRIKRLNSANKAKNSSNKYDSQKFNQRMSAAMEIGAMILMVLAMIL